MDNQRFDSEVVKGSFRKMPSYNPDSEIISTEDIPAFLKGLGYERTEQQLEAYKTYWIKLFGGKLPLNLCIAILDSADDKIKYIKSLITACDLDKSGFISVDEYKICIHVLMNHFPDFQKVDFDVFLKEADRNEDGKVSLDEALDWIKARI